jgi:hypothetical protein
MMAEGSGGEGGEEVLEPQVLLKEGEYPQTLNLLPSTLNPQPQTLNHQPQTLNPQPQTLYPQPQTLNLR